jgi:hypothetical protein
METFIASLVGALAAGAMAAAKDTATQAVKEVYASIRDYISNRYDTVPIESLEDNPLSKGYRLVIQEELEKAGGAADPDLPQLAARLTEALKAQAPEVPRAAGVVLEDIQAAIDVQIRQIAGGTKVMNVKAGTGSVIIEDIGNQPKNSV